MGEIKATKFAVAGAREHADPISGVPGAHPLGTGIGAIGVGAAAGAAGGALGGPIGAVAGATVGAIAGGFAGSAVAEKVNPTFEGVYWRENFASRPYAAKTSSFDEYEPAYRYGWESFDRFGSAEHAFDSFEAELGRGWSKVKGTSRLAWEEAKEASRDAWERVRLATHRSDESNTH